MKTPTPAYRIYLYNEIPEESINLKQVIAYLNKRCPFASLEFRGNYIAHFFSTDLIDGLADAWSNELLDKDTAKLTEDERRIFEQQALRKPELISPKIVYRGWRLLELLQDKIPAEESSQNMLHLFLTPRLPVTKDMLKSRYHARTILGGQPSVVSSTGLIEAPARPTEYYLLQKAHQMLGQEMPDTEFNERFAGRFLTYFDPRLTEVIKGYLLQAIAYRFWGEGFCENPFCRLYDAHRQKEMLTAQLEPPELCNRHQKLFEGKPGWIKPGRHNAGQTAPQTNTESSLPAGPDRRSA